MNDASDPQKSDEQPGAEIEIPQEIGRIKIWWNWLKNQPPILAILVVGVIILFSWATLIDLPGVSSLADWIREQTTPYDGPTDRGICKLFVSRKVNPLPKSSGELDNPDTDFEERVISANTVNIDVVRRFVNGSYDKAEMQFWFAKAASGKSTLASELVKMFPNEVQHLRLKDIRGDIENDAELQFVNANGQRIKISSLPSKSKCGLDDYSINDGVKVLLLDDVDEIHPRCAKEILEDAYRIIDSNKFNVIALGRPESFSSYATSSHLPVGIEQRQVYSFRAHSEDELSDIVLDYLFYKKKPKNEEERSLSVETANQYVILQRKYTFVQETVSTIGQINCMAETIHGVLQANKEFLAADMQDRFLSCALGRNKTSHNRPDAGDSMYAAAFMAVAVEYAKEAVDSNGEFEVPPDKSVTFENDGQNFSTNVQSLLSYSGIATFDPVEFRTKRFSFTPSWLHGVWLQRRAEGQYVYECDY